MRSPSSTNAITEGGKLVGLLSIARLRITTPIYDGLPMTKTGNDASKQAQSPEWASDGKVVCKPMAHRCQSGQRTHLDKLPLGVFAEVARIVRLNPNALKRIAACKHLQSIGDTDGVWRLAKQIAMRFQQFCQGMKGKFWRSMQVLYDFGKHDQVKPSPIWNRLLSAVVQVKDDMGVGLPACRVSLVMTKLLAFQGKAKCGNKRILSRQPIGQFTSPNIKYGRSRMRAQPQAESFEISKPGSMVGAIIVSRKSGVLLFH